MTRFTCHGFRSVEADGAGTAAAIFADRAARRAFGRRGYCRTLRLNSWTQDGTSHAYEAFIGRDVRGSQGATSGRNEWLTVHRAEG